MNKIAFPFLIAEIAKRGIKRKQIAEALGINYKSLYNKLTGETPLTWQEASNIRNTFFPDVAYDDLFARGE